MSINLLGFYDVEGAYPLTIDWSDVSAVTGLQDHDIVVCICRMAVYEPSSYSGSVPTVSFFSTSEGYTSGRAFDTTTLTSTASFPRITLYTSVQSRIYETTPFLFGGDPQPQTLSSQAQTIYDAGVYQLWLRITLVVLRSSLAVPGVSYEHTGYHWPYHNRLNSMNQPANRAVLPAVGFPNTTGVTAAEAFGLYNNKAKPSSATRLVGVADWNRSVAPVVAPGEGRINTLHTIAPWMTPDAAPSNSFAGAVAVSTLISPTLGVGPGLVNTVRSDGANPASFQTYSNTRWWTGEMGVAMSGVASGASGVEILGGSSVSFLHRSAAIITEPDPQPAAWWEAGWT